MQLQWGCLHRTVCNVSHVYHLEFTYVIVCNLCEHSEGFLYTGLLLSSQKAVVLQDAELYMSTRSLGLQLLQELLSCSHGELLGLLLLS